MTRTFVMRAIVGMFILWPLTAFGQQTVTVGDLVNRGAKKLTKEDVQSLYSGATASGELTSRPGVTFRDKHAPDGSVTGDYWTNGAYSGKIVGTWTVNSNGQLCVNLNNGDKCLLLLLQFGRPLLRRPK